MKIIVVGGGTAGCISALLFKAYFPSFDITIIRSSEIGILGPGEGLTPATNNFLRRIKVSKEEFIENTGATIKHGIMFKNWNSDGSSWFHGFNHVYNNFKDKDLFLKYFKVAVNKGENLNNLDFSYRMASNKKINLQNPKEYAFHVDARKLVIFLENVAKNKGIKIIDDKVIKINSNDLNNIDSVLTENNNLFDCDFVIDCSGFEKLIIGKHYSSEWQSLSFLMPATMGLTCFLPADDKFYPYTEATALKYGWSWKIPLQHRYGCGYVYDGNSISPEEAELELRELYGDSLQVNKNFVYSPGFFKTPWVNNCFANGLSSSFFEPIEATTIESMINNMDLFLLFFFPKYLQQQDKDKNSKVVQDSFNSQFVNNQFGIVLYLHMHYKNNRKDTNFWKSFNSKYQDPNKEFLDNNLPEFLKLFNLNIFDKNTIKSNFWRESSWLSLYAGNKLHENFIDLDTNDVIEYNEYIEKVNGISLENKEDHIHFLNKIKTIKEK